MDRKRLIINDFVIRPDKCNFRCRYCLAGGMEEGHSMEQEHSPEYLNDDEPLVYSQHSRLGERLDLVMKKFMLAFEAPILRISGGELFLIKGIEDFLEKQKDYEQIQIITNGFLLDQNRLTRLKKLPNCVLHISLDGVLFRQNENRVRNERNHQQLLANLENAVEMGFAIEIGSVLTKSNTGNYIVFLDYLKQLGGNVCAYPFPIRGANRKEFYPDQNDIALFAEILDVFPDYKDILPAKEFLEEVVTTLNEKRTLRCFIPNVMIQLFDDGNLAPCPNIWTNSIGNVLDDQKESILTNLYSDKMYRLFLQKRPRLDCCQACMTSLDVLNLYYEGKMKYEEITALPLYSGERTKQLLREGAR